MQDRPILIGICGAPGSGKSEVQRLLQERHGVHAFDDGEIIRRHCRELFNMSWSDVSTQDGKSDRRVIQGKVWENRDVLGEYGRALELTFGELVVPEWAVRTALRTYPQARAISFGSVRRNQGQVFLQQGGIVLEVVRSGVESRRAFDAYDTSLVTYRMVNEGRCVEELAREVDAFVETCLSKKA